MTGKDFGLAGVTDKLKRPPGKPVTGELDKDQSVAVIQDNVDPVTVLPVKDQQVIVLSEKDEPDTVTQYKGKSDTVEPVTVEPDFREEALSRLSNPSIKVLQQAVEMAKKRPRIGVYSPLVSAAAEYLRETIPKYSASDEARKILEDEFEKRYPELVRRIRTEMKQT